MYAGVELTHLTALAVGVGEEVATHLHLEVVVAPLLAVATYAGVEAHTPHPGGHTAATLKALEALPQPHQHLLEEVVGLLGTLGKHKADRVDGRFVLSDNIGEYLFFVLHKKMVFTRGFVC